MSFSQWPRVCRTCTRKRLIRLDVYMCRECLGEPTREPVTDDSPTVLTGRWVPNGRGTLDYVEDVA